MNSYRILMLIVTLGTALSSVNPATAAGEPRKGDSWLTAKTKIVLFADTRVKGHEVNVETKTGIVMLRGKVDNDEAKRAAEEIAKGIEGVAGVKNELQVVPRSERESVEEKDEVIADLVTARMRAIKNAHIMVKVNAGVVSLNGDAGSMATSAKASWKAWLVKGVKAVKNDITVKN